MAQSGKCFCKWKNIVLTSCSLSSKCLIVSSYHAIIFLGLTINKAHGLLILIGIAAFTCRYSCPFCHWHEDFRGIQPVSLSLLGFPSSKLLVNKPYYSKKGLRWGPLSFLFYLLYVIFSLCFYSSVWIANCHFCYCCRYARDLMRQITAYVIDMSSKKDLKIIAQQPDAILWVSWKGLKLLMYFASTKAYPFSTSHIT